MDCQHARDRFTTAVVIDNKDGFWALELFRTRDGVRRRLARAIYWDADGQFYLDSFEAGTEIPVTILEGLVAEAKSAIKAG